VPSFDAGASLDPLSVYAQTGYAAPTSTAQSISPGAMPGIARSSLNSSTTGLLSLKNPMTWFGIFAGATLGLIAFSSTVRVGKAETSFSIGKK